MVNLSPVVWSYQERCIERPWSDRHAVSDNKALEILTDATKYYIGFTGILFELKPV